ncbi:hypothetical protein ENUP19_0194G0027 [Entamoeba nuttalli]|uniref:Uncharacterized protein n=2 Tax=Entamoeba nuttalli TaxID=412467 RepID=K2GU83_ENTNP|nr:hypothetical protein ENU1_198450 [Entamoeba nuttalli P19]EKE37412.1 hypothetical protein ENU1_198450 [Entamoeba nuttalli P19]|eukprot:XP_008860258.1 hypothetical protein ENU1_198450 [Entamoeba nuttalli P19]
MEQVNQVTSNSTESRCKRGNSINARKEREFKNQLAFQHCLLIGVLNQFASIVLEKPGKQSKMTTTIPFVFSIIIDKTILNIKDLAEYQCSLIKKEEIQNGLPFKTVNRRYKKNISATIMNLVYDICYELGVNFISKLSKQSNKSVQIERIDKIYLNEQDIIPKENIMSFGRQINLYLLSLLSNKKQLVLKKEDKSIQSLLEQSILHSSINSPSSQIPLTVSSSF